LQLGGGPLANKPLFIAGQRRFAKIDCFRAVNVKLLPGRDAHKKSIAGNRCGDLVGIPVLKRLTTFNLPKLGELRSHPKTIVSRAESNCCVFS
jgi:hypothetical protein